MAASIHSPKGPPKPVGQAGEQLSLQLVGTMVGQHDEFSPQMAYLP